MIRISLLAKISSNIDKYIWVMLRMGLRAVEVMTCPKLQVMRMGLREKRINTRI
jgi:hypothetical protein